ncbi:hypothetical protein FRC00_008944, partial [Tulasnella sp. 408]
MPSSPSAPAKTIILSFDGTLGKFTKDSSNVARLHGLLDRGNMDQQAVYFQPGVGSKSDDLATPGSYLGEGGAWYSTMKYLKEKLDSGFA